MIVSNYSNYNVYSNRPKQNNIKNDNVNFSGKGFDWIANQCKIESNGSLKRLTFFAVALAVMVGARFKKARGEDEKREVLTRDVPAVYIAAYGAPVLNNALAYAATKKTGIPIAQFTEGKPKGIRNASFVSQKQVKDWYSGFEKLKDPLITLSETIQRHGGNIKKVMEKLELDKELKAISEGSSNEEIMEALKKAKGSEGFNILEGKIKELKDNNKVLTMAKNIQGSIRMAGIAVVVAILGFALPRLNIVTTRKKYQQKQQAAAAHN